MSVGLPLYHQGLLSSKTMAMRTTDQAKRSS